MLSELRKLLRSDLKMIANGKLGGIWKDGSALL
jgi:hypothetical protein